MTGTKAPPAGLRRSGRAFWRSVLAAYELDARDEPVLLEVCRTLDEVDLLREVVDRDGVTSTGSAGQVVEHPALTGLRAHRATLDRLLLRLALPDERGLAPRSAASLAAQKAAQSRWARRAARQAG